MVIIIEDLIVANLEEEGRGLLDLLMEIGAIPKRFECPKCQTEMKVFFEVNWYFFFIN